MISWRFGSDAIARLEEPDRVALTIIGALNDGKAPARYEAETLAISSLGPYWTLPGRRRRQVDEFETSFPGDASAVEESLNSRHLEDYDSQILFAPLEFGLRAGVGAIMVVRKRLTELGQVSPFNFRLSASEYKPDDYQPEPSEWPMVFTFSRYRGAEDDFGPHVPRQPSVFDASSFEIYARFCRTRRSHPHWQITRMIPRIAACGNRTPPSASWGR